MPSFLSRVFGRKKDDTKEVGNRRPSSDASLLEGKFEAVPPTISPIASRFDGSTDASAIQDKEKEKDGFGLFRPKSRVSPTSTPGQSQSTATQKGLDYHLSLNLPGPKEEATRALGVVFEADPDAQILESESVIAERKLSPLEAFLLVQACSQAINARGLETLGIMIPHWYSASPVVQRKLVSLFIQSLAVHSPITTLSPTASSPVAAFESEISTTRSPHDVAAVLRWGLRHLQLDNSSFGKDDTWYTQFLAAEKASEYPPKAFTEKLVPLLPPAHLHLLTTTLELFSSLAAHAEANSISGSKLSKMLGFWILSAPRIVEGDDVLTFYARWEKWGRILEHLFLARIRDEAADHRMPTRLMELVNHYPYLKSSPGSDPAFLPQPRFSTRRYDTLFVRIETEISSTETNKQKNHPLRLIADALKASSRSPSPSVTGASSASLAERDLWESLKKHVSMPDADSESYPGLSSLFADETIRFLSLIPASGLDSDKRTEDAAPFTLFIPPSKVGRRRSMSLGDKDTAAAAVATAHVKNASSVSSDAHVLPDAGSIGVDWSQFSTSGFFAENGTAGGSKLAETLLDNKDVEVTMPRKTSTKRKLPPALVPLPSTPGRGKSLDLPAVPKEPEIKQGKSRATKFQMVQLDEAFIDFWSDALLDPVSADWPGFVLCKIRSSVAAGLDGDNGKKVAWLIIEQRFVTPHPPIVPATPETDGSQPRPRPVSPNQSFQSESKSTKKKRFSFFTSLSSSSIASASSKADATKGKKKGGKEPKIGEMGEILKEEEEPTPPAKKSDIKEPSISAGQVAPVAAVGAAAAVATIAEDPQESIPASTSLVGDASNVQMEPTSEEPPRLSATAPDTTGSLVKDVNEAQITDAPPSVDTHQPTPPVISEPKLEESAPVVDQAVPQEPTPPIDAAQSEPEVVLAAADEQRDAPVEVAQSGPEVVLANDESVAADAEEQLAEERRVQAEMARVAAEEVERARVEQERLATEAKLKLAEEQLAEERRLQAEKAAEEERARAEQARLETEAKLKLAEEHAQQELERQRAAEAQRLAEAEQKRLDELAAQEALERERAAEAQRQAEEQKRLEEQAAQEALERERAAEAQRQAEEEKRLEEARQQEELERQRAAEAQRLAEAEQKRLDELAAQEALERERAAEAQRQAEEERRLEEARQQEELERQRAAEAQRLAEAEQKRLEEQAAQEALERERAAEAQRQAEEEKRLEEARQQEELERQRAAEAQRLAEAEQKRLEEQAAQEALERERAAEAQRQAEEEKRLEEARQQEELERQRAAEAQRLAEAEQKRLDELAAQEALERERAAEAQRQAEEERRLEEARQQEELERQRAAEAQRQAEEEERRLEEARQKEELERERAAEAQRLAEERRLQAEKAAEEERVRLEQQAQADAAAAEAQRLRQIEEEEERARLEEAKRLEQQAQADAAAAEAQRLRQIEEDRLDAERLERRETENVAEIAKDEGEVRDTPALDVKVEASHNGVEGVPHGATNGANVDEKPVSDE